MVVLALAGPESEKEFCGPASDDGDQLDYEMAQEYGPHDRQPPHAAAELIRYRDAAQRLVSSPWGRQRITVLAEALLQHGRLTGDQIAGLASPYL